MSYRYPIRRFCEQVGFSIAGVYLTAALATAPAMAQEAWPNRPVKLIVPYAAGGLADIRARKIGVYLSQRLGQPVVVDNRAGAGGVVGTDAIAKATDGYTFGFGSPGPLVTNAYLMKKLPYDPVRDLQPVVLLEIAPLFLVTAEASPLRSVQELIAAAKANPGGLSYGSSGIGGAHHLSAELLKLDSNTDMVHVPYKGGALASTDLMAGQLSFMFEMGYSAVPAVKARRIRALAVSSKHRLKILPDVPTLQEAGIPKFESYNWLGVIAPRSIPKAVLVRLSRELNAILQEPDVRSMIEDSGGEVVGGSPDDYAKFLAAERKTWEPVIRSANIQIE